MKLRLRAAAVGDLDSIFEYSVEHFGVETAAAYLSDIDTSFRRLTDYPELGVRRPDLDSQIRCLQCREHCVYYSVGDKTVSVWRVLHRPWTQNGGSTPD